LVVDQWRAVAALNGGRGGAFNKHCACLSYNGLKEMILIYQLMLFRYGLNKAMTDTGD